MFHRELYVKTAKRMRDIGDKGKNKKQESALNVYREKLIQIAGAIAKKEKERGTELEAAIIIGSIARGNHSLESDLDLYLVFSDSRLLIKEDQLVDGVEVELFKIGYETLVDQIETNKKNMFLFKDGLLVYDGPNQLGVTLIERAKNRYNSGTDSWSEDVIEEKKEEFSNIRYKVKKLMEKDEMSSLLILQKYTLLAVEAFYQIRGLWQPADKDMISDLKEKSPRFAHALENCLQQWRASYRFNFWLRLIDTAFEPVGGLPEDEQLRIKD